MNRQGMSERQYAERIGLSRAAVAKAKLLGKLVLFSDGSIDAPASDKRRMEHHDPAKQQASLQAGERAVVDTLQEQGVTVAAAGPSGVNYANARTANEMMKAQLRRIELQRKKGEVVDRARATSLVFRLARQERDVWVGWPARVAALMAAELGVSAHQMQTMLERYVREQLAGLADVRPEFR